jgi:hypothetical protein
MQITMTDAIAESHRRMGTLLRRGDRSFALSRYEVGQIIAQYKSAGRDDVVQFEAEFYGYSVATLLQWARVTEAWPNPVDFNREFMQKSAKPGFVLSWSHMCVVSVVPDVDERQAFLGKCRNEGLSVVQLETFLALGRSRTPFTFPTRNGNENGNGNGTENGNGNGNGAAPSRVPFTYDFDSALAKADAEQKGFVQCEVRFTAPVNAVLTVRALRAGVSKSSLVQAIVRTALIDEVAPLEAQSTPVGAN